MNAQMQGYELVADYDLPAPACSVRPRVNSHYPLIRELHAAWVYKFLPPARRPGELPRAVAELDAYYDAMAFPDGDPELVAHHACMLSTFVAFDDLAFFDPALCADVEAHKPDTPYSAALDDLWKTLDKTAPSKRVASRLRERFEEAFYIFERESKLRSGEEVADLQTYFKVHRSASGMRPYFTGAEYVHGIDVAEIVADPDAELAKECVAEHCILVNDLYSYRRECFHGDSINSINMMRDKMGYSLQQAIGMLRERLADLDTQTADLLQCLHRRYAQHPLGELAHRYIDTYHSIAAGNLQWHLESPRYNGRGYVWDGRRDRHVTVNSKLDPIVPW